MFCFTNSQQFTSGDFASRGVTQKLADEMQKKSRSVSASVGNRKTMRPVLTNWGK